MNLTSENTAIVLDSTSDYPDAPARFPNMRLVPLYVRFGDETYKDYVELGPTEFYEKLRVSPVTPATAQPTPQDFVTAYEELAGYERIYSLHVTAKLSGFRPFERRGLCVSAALHAVFVYRVVRARVAASRQRAVVLESFRALLKHPNA